MATTPNASRSTAAPARKTTPRSATAKTAATRRSAAGKKAATTRTRKQAASTRQAAERRAQRTVEQTTAQAERRAERTASRVQDYAGKAVLVQVGAALAARDSVASTIDELRSNYSTRAKAQRELQRFERRGTTALNSVEREVKKTRTRVERELRQRRTRVQRDVRSVTRTPINKQAGLVGARVEHAVQSSILTGAQVAARVQERVASLV